MHMEIAYTSELSVNKFLLQVFRSGGQAAVDFFVILSGYFLIKQQFKLKHLIKMMGEVWLYSVIILLIALYIGIDGIGFKKIIKGLLPFGINTWFAYTYFVMYLLFPFINSFLLKLSQKNYLLLLLLGFVLWFCFPTFTKVKMQFSPLVLFCYLYSVGAYFKIFYQNKKINNALKILICGYLFMLLTTIGVDLMSLKYDCFIKKPFYFTSGQTNVFSLIVAIGWFLYFKDKKIKHNKYINFIASTTFGIYLLHANSLTEGYLYNSVFNNQEYFYSEFMILHAVFTIFLIFIVCSFIDYWRLTFIEKPLFKYLNPKIDNLETKLRAKLDIILERIIRKTV